MVNIKGTIITLRDFLFDKESKIEISYNDEKYPIINFKKGRILSVPDYQREIRWQKETLLTLMNDISKGSKFIGNVILSLNDNINYDIIDGQQRLIALNMLVNYIKNKYSTQITDIDDLVKINLNCFDDFRTFQDSNYDLNNLQDELIREKVKNSDKLNQIPRLSQLYKSISESSIISNALDAQLFLRNLKLCTLNVIISNDPDSQISTEYYIDVNLKGIKLDVEDIFKGYLFAQDSSQTIRDLWVDFKETWIKFNATCGSKDVYPLTKILEHYLYCYILCKPEYKEVSINENFRIDKSCTVNNATYYGNEHVIKVIMNNTYMIEVLEGSKNYVKFLTDIVSTIDGVPECINTLLSEIQLSDRKIICNFIKKMILDKTLIVPKTLILKYYLTICNKKASKEECKYFYAIYFYQVLFMLFGDKKHDVEQIKKIARSESYYKETITVIKEFLDISKLMDSKLNALARWNSNYENEELQYKCKSLATIYNFFMLNQDQVKVTSSQDVDKFLTDTADYSIEHFITSQSQKVKCRNTELDLPNGVKKYSNYIFNYVFIPKTLNEQLANYHVKRKLALLEPKEQQALIKCDYSKMILELVKESFIEEMPNAEKANDPDFEKYWLVTFRNEFKNFTDKVVDKLIERFTNK